MTASAAGANTETVPPCRICGSTDLGSPFSAREMLHGTREAFSYVACRACGCVQIEPIPDDLARFYPGGYFSFRDHRGLDRNIVRRLVDPLRVRNAFGEPSLIGAAAEAISRPFDYVTWIKRAGLGRDARVLDVGCGAGKTLLEMALGGFPAPQGVDPFIASTLRYRRGVTVHKSALEDFAAGRAGAFDLIMFHHSLEHLAGPLAALRTAERLLSPRGRMLIVAPVADSFAFAHYGADWFNLDPPRHLHLLTGPAMVILAADAGLAVIDARSAGHLSQFTGSERYRRDIAANDPRRDRDLFSARDIAAWRAKAEALNRDGRGDQTMFILARA